MIDTFDVKKAYALLELERKIVGVKLAKSKEEYQRFEAKEIVSPLSYCVAVKVAMMGNSIKFTKENSGCGGSTRALGLVSPSQGFYDGTEGCKLGLYENEKVAASVSEKMKLCPTDTYGVIVKPLELFEEEPNLVLMVSNSKNVMRIIQGYTYVFGMQPNFNLTGNQAVCVECSSYPLMTDDINISLFCSGTRFLAKWKDTEVAVGMPYNKFSKVVEGVRLTVNAVEMDKRKEDIKKELEKLDYDGNDIMFNHTYYLDLERDKRERKHNAKTKK